MSSFEQPSGRASAGASPTGPPRLAERGTSRIATRIGRLGTETAFAVAAETTALAAEGHEVFAFHIGDLNLGTPANIVEATFRAARDGRTGYCPPFGIPELREAIADDVSASHGIAYRHGNVAVQPGGKPVIGKFLLALMEPGDEVLYPNPGYPIYESQIEFHGGRAVPYGYLESPDGFSIDLEGIEAALSPRTRLLILNDLQNPLGAECSKEELARLAELVERHDLLVLCDEAYFDIRYEGSSRSFAALPGMAERCVLLFTFSKRYAMTGWRLGAAIGPEEVIDVIGRLNVNDESCTNQFVQVGGVEGLRGDQSGANRIVEVLRERRDVAVAGLDKAPGIRCHAPRGTFYLFPNVTEAMARIGERDVESFRRRLLRDTGVSTCSRVHFGRPSESETEHYLRLAYAGIDATRIDEGLRRLCAYLEQAQDA